MASRHASKKLYAAYPSLRKGIKEVQRDVFSQNPNLYVRTGHRKAKKAFAGVYINQYYIDPLDVHVRKVCNCSVHAYFVLLLLLHLLCFW